MWNIVWVLPQGHRSVSVSCHFLLQALQCPCTVRKRFSRGRSKPSCRIVGSHTRWELTSSYASIDFWCQLAGCKSSHNGFLDVSCSNGGLRILGWIGQLSCLTIFSTSLSVAAFLRMITECWRWRPRWNWLASSTSCFGSSACLQSSSSVLCRAAYGLESPQDRLGGTHAAGAGYPDKLTIHRWRWYYAGIISPADLWSHQTKKADTEGAK